MPKYKIITEIEAGTLFEAWGKSAHGHPTSFAPGQDWSGFLGFKIQEVSSEISMTVEKENN